MDIKGLLFSLFKPVAPAGSVNLPIQVDVNGPNTTVSVSAPLATSSAPGLAQADGTSITAAAGVLSVAANQKLGTIGLVIDGGGSTPATGAKGVIQVPYACTITGWTMLGDVSGSAQITVSKGAYSGFPTVSSIVASAPPNLSSAQKATSSTLTGWTTAISAGDILSFNLDSISTITRLILELQVTRS